MSESRGIGTSLKPGTRGEVPPEPKIWTIRKPVPPRASRLMAVPEMIWSASKVMHMSAWIRAKISPAASAKPRPTRALPAREAPTTPAKAEISIRPSSPMLTTPLLSLNMPPKAAKIRGVALRIVEAKRVPRDVRTSSTTLQPSLQPGARKRPGALADYQLDQLRSCHEEQNHGEQHVGELQRDVGRELHLLGARGHPAEENGAEDDPYGVVAPQEGDPDAVEAYVLDERYGHLAVDAEHLLPAAQSSQEAADSEGEDRVQADTHAGVASRPRREADGPDHEPPFRAPQEQLVRRVRHEREDEAVVCPPEPRREKRDTGCEVYRFRAGDEPLAPEGLEGKVGRQVDPDVVQHDRGDHLVRPEVSFEEAGYGAPEEPRQGAGCEGQDHPEDPEGAQIDADDGCGYRPDPELSLPADIEEPGAEGDGHGEAGEDQGRRVEQCPPDGERRPERSPQERPEGRHRVVPRHQHDDRPDDEGDEDRYEGEDQSPCGVCHPPAERRAAAVLSTRVSCCSVLAHRRALTRSSPRGRPSGGRAPRRWRQGRPRRRSCPRR